jgi:hypothetical protein
VHDVKQIDALDPDDERRGASARSSRRCSCPRRPHGESRGRPASAFPAVQAARATPARGSPSSRGRPWVPALGAPLTFPPTRDRPWSFTSYVVRASADLSGRQRRSHVNNVNPSNHGTFTNHLHIRRRSTSPRSAGSESKRTRPARHRGTIAFRANHSCDHGAQDDSCWAEPASHALPRAIGSCVCKRTKMSDDELLPLWRRTRSLGRDREAAGGVPRAAVSDRPTPSVETAANSPIQESRR